MASADEVRTIRIVVDASRAVDGSAAATRAIERMEKAQSSMASSMAAAETVITRFFGAFLGTQGFRAVIEAADAFTKFSNSLRVTGIQGEALAAVQTRLFAAANRNGVEIGALGQLYGRVAMTSRELGASQTDMLKFVDGVTAALRVQGGSTEQASGALLQLSQAMGAGIVRAEEFNSILEGALPIAQAAARGIDGMNGSVAKLRSEVVEGNVTSRQFFEGLLRGFEQTKVQAQSASMTIGGAMTALQNSWVKFAGAMDEATGASNIITTALGRLAQVLENVGKLAKGARGDLLFLVSLAANPSMIASIALARPTTAVLDDKLGTLRKEAEESRERLGKITGDGMLASAQRNREQTYLDARLNSIAQLERERQVAAVGGKVTALADDPDNVGLMPKTKPQPILKKDKAGESLANRIADLMRDNTRDLAAANAFAEASERGAQAVEALEVKFKALKAAQDAYGDTADKNKAQVDALADRIEKMMQAAARAQNLKSFNLATVELEKSNELLEAENRLINASTETRARELGLIRLRHEVESKGLDASNEKEREAIERRASAIEQNERLKAQGEELRKAQELWTAPLKKALESIQQTAADAFDKMLESGKFSFASLGDVFKTTIRRMIAEFLALATIRPVMSVVVQGLGGAGLVSPGTASALGYGTAGGQVGGFGGSLGGFGGGSLGGGGLGSIFGGGSSGGGWMGSVGEWLNTPFTGPYAGMSPSSMAGVPTLSPSLMSPSTWSITPMQGLGAAAGIGMGAYTLATGKGGTGSTISGIGQMIGGAVSLIPGFGQIAGPIIGLASSIIGGLIGDGGYKLPPISSGNQRYTPTADFKGSFNNYTWAGGQELGGKYAYTWNTISELLQRTGGKLDPSKAWSGEIYENQRDGTSYTYLLDPNMNSTGIGGGSGNQSWTLDAMVAQVFSKNVKYAMTGISETLRKAVNNREPGTEVEVRQLLELVEAYDTFGKVVPTAKKALEELNDKFDALASTARLYSLDLAPIDAERKKMTERYANDFIDGMLNPLQVQLRSLEDERKQSLANAEYIRDNVEGVYVDIEKITSYWNQRKLDLEAQYYEQSYGQIETLIRRLTYGDLANASATLSLSGARATYEATLAQARAGSQTAISGLAGDAEAYANTARSYYGSTVPYDQLIAELRQQLEEFTAAATGSGTTPAAANDSASVAAQNNAELRNMVRTLADTVQRQSGEIAELTAVLKRQRG